MTEVVQRSGLWPGFFAPNNAGPLDNIEVVHAEVVQSKKENEFVYLAYPIVANLAQLAHLDRSGDIP